MKCALHSEKLFISIALHNFFLPTFCSRTSACNFFCVWSTNPCALAVITEHANHYPRFAMLHRALILYKDKQFAKKVPQFQALTKKVLYCWNSCLTLWLFYPPPPPPECVRRYSDKTVITVTLSSFKFNFLPSFERNCIAIVEEGPKGKRYLLRFFRYWVDVKERWDTRWKVKWERL